MSLLKKISRRINIWLYFNVAIKNLVRTIEVVNLRVK